MRCAVSGERCGIFSVSEDLPPERLLFLSHYSTGTIIYFKKVFDIIRDTYREKVRMPQVGIFEKPEFSSEVVARICARPLDSPAASRENLTRNIRNTCPPLSADCKESPPKAPPPTVTPFSRPIRRDGSGRGFFMAGELELSFCAPVSVAAASPSPSFPVPSRPKTAAPRTAAQTAIADRHG